MKRTVWSIVVVLVAFGVAFGAPIKTGKDLLAQLDSKEQCDKDSALGYVTGSYAGHSGQSMGFDRSFETRLAEAVKKFLKENEGRLDQPASKLLVELFEQESFKKQFPAKAVQVEGEARKP